MLCFCSDRWESLGPSDVDFSQHSPTTRPSVEMTAAEAFSLSDCIELSSAEALAEGIQVASFRLCPLGPLGLNSPIIAQRHALPYKGLQMKHLCFRIAFFRSFRF